jgi:hypothetical protein
MKIQVIKKDGFIMPNKYSPESVVMFEHLVPSGKVEDTGWDFETFPFYTLVNAHGWKLQWLVDHTPQG